LNVSRNWSNYSLNAETRWYDNVIARRQLETDATLQKLPFIEFNALKQRLLNTFSYFDLDSEYTYFFREDGTKGHRFDVHPRIYLPLRYKHYFTFEPSLGVRETAWRIDEDETISTQKDRKLHRELYDVTLDLSTELFHIYRMNGKNIDKIKHSIRPQIVYDYIPNDPDLALYPIFDEEIDQIQKKNLVTYSITNTFTSKSKNHTKEKGKSQKTEYNELSNIYRDFCRFKLEQSYNINEAKEDNPANWANKVDKRPFSPIYGELELIPGNYFSMQADAEWCQYESDFLSHNVAVNVSDKRKDRIFVEHRYTRNSSRSIYTDLLLKISDRLSAYSSYERNIYDKKTIKSSLGFLYNAQCWSIELGYTHEQDDRSYTFMINLHGLGEFGSSIEEGYHM
jgi:LPS-assembly protein